MRNSSASGNSMNAVVSLFTKTQKLVILRTSDEDVRRTSTSISPNNFPWKFHLRPFSAPSASLCYAKRIPPNGSNRGRYRNPKVDELTDAIRVEMNQPKRKELTSQVQKIVAEDLVRRRSQRPPTHPR